MSEMIEEEAVQDGMTTDIPRRERIDSGPLRPKREQIAMWTIKALQSISNQIVKNVWCHRDFGWFPEDTEGTLVRLPSKFYDKIMLTLPCMPCNHCSWR